MTADNKVKTIAELSGYKISTAFYRVSKNTDMPFGAINQRMVAVPQRDGKWKLRVDEVNTGAESVMTAPGFLQDIFRPASDKNLSLEQALVRLQRFRENMLTVHELNGILPGQSDFELPRKCVTLDHALAVLQAAAPK